MKVIQINATSGMGSTGKICVALSNIMTEKGIDNLTLYSYGNSKHSNSIKYTSDFYIKVNAFKSKILGNYGFNSVIATKKIIEYINSFKPDIIHLHNLHSHNLNFEIFFEEMKKHKYKIIWTFHDCWAFTAYCVHFTMDNCSKWITGCENCPQVKKYSWFIDNSKTLYNKKRELLNGLNLHIVTPSHWLADLVKQSYLKDYPVKVINNGIDLNIFKPTLSNFRDKYSLTGKYIVLGVAFDWGKRKGLDVFIELSKRLDASKYQIVLVGTDEKADKQLPKNIISIHRTQNQTELAEIYTAADIFVNPTREENYPTVNMEALACGTPVLTFRTGGSPEILNETCGSVVDCDDIDSFEREIMRICEEKPYSTEACLERVKAYHDIVRFEEYIKLYEDITHSS